jgi:putative copper export protein
MDGPMADVLVGATRVLLYAGFVLLAGTLSFWVLVWPEGRFDRRQLLLVDDGMVLLAVATVIGPLVTVLVNGAIESISGEAAAAALLRLAVIAVIAAWLPELVDDPTVRRRRATLGAIVVALSLTMAIASDAMTGHLVALKIVATFGHLLGAAAWLGGLVALAVVIIPGQRLDQLDELVPSFSKVSFVSVVTLAVTGTVHALAQAGGPAALASTPFGVVLLLKVTVFAGMLVLGNHGRRYANEVVLHRLRARHRASTGVHTLAVVMGAELATAGAVLLTTAVLVAVAPLG